ncbi:ATPase [Amycolatopsis mediterranei S699]|uniref:Predicted ATPase n=2 Tax=Amycolatopsis mediterranei TaxID=33910 RepID=A0A0H3DBU4_AMYMU|nr:AAA family ATPase [Amycolatopsis mediterranei]ADJ47533.1 predicted ATPase [Amycolatopsis mediterranei U32]AFO79244.1 ATPase [Amycolatopsis mediterranei S699]AGT86372.1 ATPase [Amycolatopsis mediterranei RB]KDO12536.1 ATPase [Amycolatopsis mediterranei]KDU88621.1 ATPase [Amycolatopsis mediterranei]
MENPQPAVHRTIIAVDIEGYGDPRRTNPHRLAVRAGLYSVMRQAFEGANIPWAKCDLQDLGDGLFILAPPEMPKAHFVEVVPHLLVAALCEHNSTRPVEERIRLRMTLHAGEVAYDDHGVTATSINLAFRLLDAKPLKDALAESSGLLAVIASEWFFGEVIRNCRGIDPAMFRLVQVDVKETMTTGWVNVIDRHMPDNMSRAADNLPAELTSFVGRRHELKEAKRLLSTARLLTLTGSGGVGKTRLALRIAAELRADFTDGVWLVELAELRDSRLLPSAVATVLGLRDTADPAAGLAEFLRDRQLLLVLDNCEHMADECAALVTKLLTAADQVRVLATCRHVLHAEGEHVLCVEPMVVPHDVDASGGREAAGSKRQTDAVTLFIDRAAAAVPHLKLAPRDMAAVKQICARLEGIPLALELAAVWLRVLSVDQLLQRLVDRFALLTMGPCTVRARQRTLEATIDWSYELCSPDEQWLWAQLSVFPGGFDLEAVEHIGEVEHAPNAGVLGVLTGLMDKSVLFRQKGAFCGHTWYWMLETVRAYGAGKLAERGGEQDVRLRQAEYYVAVAQRYRCEGFGPGQLEWVARLRREHANLRAVMDHCLSIPDRASQALDIAASLWNFWYGGALVREGYRHLHEGLELCHGHTLVRAQALYAASFLAIQIGEAGPAGEMLAELSGLAESFGDERLRAGYAECSGMSAFFAGDLSGGAELLERALAGYRAAGDALLVFDALVLLAAMYFFLDDPRGEAVAAEAVALTERHEARWSRGYALWAVAIHRWRSGRPREAAGILREAIALRLADRTLLAFLFEALTWCHSSAAEYERAARLLGCTVAIWRQSGARINETSPYQTFDEQCAERTSAALGAEAFDTAFTEGAGSGLDAAIRYALDENPQPQH